MATPENKLSLKVLVDIQTKKVIFAEAGHDFMDVLFGFLTLPIGTIIRQLEKHFDKQTNFLGCMNKLYGSVRNLGNSYFCTDECKLMLLHPENASEIECQKLKLKIDDSEPTRYYGCVNFPSGIKKKECTGGYTSFRPVSTYIDRAGCSCGYLMNVLKTVSTQYYEGGSTNEGVFTATTKSFIVTDELLVMPIDKNPNFEFLRNLISGANATEEHILSVGSKEVMHLLKLALLSRTPLTNFFHQLKSNTTIINPEPTFMVHSPQCLKDAKTDFSIELRALVQKSTCKLLLFLAGDDFVEFLFTILTFPLGSVVSLLDGNSNVPSVDHLYKSISELSSDYLLSPSVKALLINPKLPPNYLSKKTSQLYSLSEKLSPSGFALVDPKGDQGYMKAQETYMVTDDLVVSPMSFISIMSYLSTRNIPCSDVEESVLKIGTKEALDILKASLTSTTSVLSSALKFIGKQSKIEN